MIYLIYTVYGILLAIFLVLAGFAVYHALRHAYLSPRVRPVTWVFLILSALLVAVSVFLLLRIEL